MRARCLALFLTLSGSQIVLAQLPPGDRCAAAVQATGYAACAEAPHGIALAGTSERATSLAKFAQAGEERFTHTFSATPTPFAVAELREQDTLQSDTAKLKALGYSSILPWISDAKFSATLTSSMNKAAAAQARAQGLSKDAEAELARTLLAAQAKQMTRFKRDESDSGTVPHELGHMWFGETYWPKRPPSEGRYYGTPAPDWLDETAAVLVEGQEMADGRRRTFVNIYHGRGTGAFANQPVAELIDLRLFLTRTHPGFGRFAAEHAEQRRTGRTQVILQTGAEAAASARIAGMFYSTARLVADYMIDRGGGPAVFPAVATAVSRGESFESWLRREGTRFRLPATLDALEADWRGWLRARFGEPGSAPKATA